MDLLTAAAGLTACLVVLSPATGAHADALTEPMAKAAVLFNLATYTTWPEERSSLPDLVIGVAGPDPVLDALAAVNGKRVQGRTIRIREIRPENDAKTCDILYIPGTFTRRFALLRSVGTAPVLTVGDRVALQEDGTAVRVFFERSRLKLEIELSLAERANLRISSKLLSLARVLRNGQVVTSVPRP